MLQKESPIPRQLKARFTDWEPITPDPSYYFNYRVKDPSNDRYYLARVFNLNADFTDRDYDAAASQFIREAMYLCSRLGPETIILETFEIDDKKIGFAVEDLQPLNTIKDHSGLQLDQFIKSVVSEMGYLNRKFKPAKFNLDLDKIYLSKKGSLFIGDWVPRAPNSDLTSAFDDKNSPEFQILMERSTTELDTILASKKLKENPIDSDAYQLGLTSLRLAGVHQSCIKQLLSSLEDNESYELFLGAILKDKLKLPENTSKMVRSLLQREPLEITQLRDTIIGLGGSEVELNIPKKSQGNSPGTCEI